MRLKNKRSGEIKEFVLFDGKNELQGGATLKDLVEEWEDYEDPKNTEYYWYIGYKNDIRRTRYNHISNFADNQITQTRKEIGNCFESLEEAEKAVEKLKAWKRLKDKGFRFTGFTHKDRGRMDELEIYCQLGECPEDIEDMEDLDLLFGGEE